MKPHILILGAGFAGHTAALHLSYLVRNKADVTVVAPNNRFTWFPSLIWVGTGTMSPDDVHFELAPVYEKIGVSYVDGRATTIKPDDREVTVQTASGEELWVFSDRAAHLNPAVPERVFYLHGYFD